MTRIAELKRQAEELLRDAGSESPRLDAEILLSAVTGMRREQILAYGEKELTDADEQRFVSMLHRRMQSEPVAYIVGEKEFYGRSFKTAPAVLIPRPETELLVERVLDRMKYLSAEEEPIVFDIGTGSGAIIVTLVLEIRARFGFRTLTAAASDVSEPALEVARENAERHGVGEAIQFFRADLLSGLPIHQGSIAVIAANLPYIANGAPLPPDVARHEPATALFSGRKGLDAINALITQVCEKKPCGRGVLLLEVGSDQRPALESRLSQSGMSGIFYDDLQGLPRVLEISYREEMC